ncbi:MAG TPA: hypothetical protein VGO71_14505 [Baekduia sp.]|nr:hypothetical protein [Baekduia sp.]
MRLGVPRVVEVEIEAVGTLVNPVVDEVAAGLSGPATANGARRPPSGRA